uniref:hypothetical protein n=1 Tax=Acinetobacter sp. TaxID=472 RepID=UPI00389095C8
LVFLRPLGLRLKKESMPENGVETEFFPVQTFVRDFVAGQTYAVEIAHAYLSYGPPAHGILYTSEKPIYDFVKELVDNFGNAEVYSMVGFAMKQTFDYVKRGERLNAAKAVLAVVDKVVKPFAGFAPGSIPEPRLDTILGEATVLEHLVKATGLETEVLMGGNKPQNSLKLNGRNYMESTTLAHFHEQVVKMVKQFGDRSNAAAEKEVDYKSLSHAVRVYEQAIELLETGKITFPRPNADYLRKVKQGEVPLDDVKLKLSMLDESVQQMIEVSTMRKRTPELEKAAEDWLTEKLMDLYKLNEA